MRYVWTRQRLVIGRAVIEPGIRGEVVGSAPGPENLRLLRVRFSREDVDVGFQLSPEPVADFYLGPEEVTEDSPEDSPEDYQKIAEAELYAEKVELDEWWG